MAMAKGAVVTMTIMALFGASMAATYTVGDTAGWTTQGKIDYNKWTEGKEFRVGDTITFKYNKAFHDVQEVTQQNYESCNEKLSLKQYTSGSDSITLNKPGHHYFICGVPGHCQAGQKVEINVVGDASSPGASPASAPGPATSSSSGEGSATADPAVPAGGGSSSTPSATASSSGSATSLYSSNFWLAAPGMLAVLVAGFAF